VLSIDTSSGAVNHSPIAALKVSPDFAGAPSEITLDASASFDSDGIVAELRWDVDGDGSTDYSSIDPVPPEQSSGGLADTIIPGATMFTLSTRYTQGSADWYWPRVQVVDNEGATSVWTKAKLGISGWETRILNTTMDDYEMGLWPDAIGSDPVTNQLVIARRGSPDYIAAVGETGLFLAREESPGEWSYEAIIDDLTEEEVSAYTTRYILWDEHSQPVLLMQHIVSGGGPQPFTYDVYTAQRQTNGVWDVRFQFFSSDPENVASGSGIGFPVVQGPGRFAAIVSEDLIDPDSTEPYPYYGKFYLLFYDHGEWSLEYTGLDSRETTVLPSFIYARNDGSICGLLRNTAQTPSGIWQTEWQDGVGFGEPQRIDDGSLSFSSGTYPREGLTDGTGTTYVTHSGSQDGRDPVFVKIAPSGTSLTPIKQIKPGEALAQVLLVYTPNLHLVPGGAGFLLSGSVSFAPGTPTMQLYYRLENQTWIIENLLPPAFAQYDTSQFVYAHAGTADEPVVLLKQNWPIDGSPGWQLFMLAERVDPRI
jgi:hypothetical protein